MWILIYQKLSLEVQSLISIFNGNIDSCAYLTKNWHDIFINDIDHMTIQLETKEELEQVIHGSKGIEVKKIPVLVKVNKKNIVKGIYYMNEIFDADEFNIAIEIDSFIKS